MSPQTECLDDRKKERKLKRQLGRTKTKELVITISVLTQSPIQVHTLLHVVFNDYYTI